MDMTHKIRMACILLFSQICVASWASFNTIQVSVKDTLENVELGEVVVNGKNVTRKADRFIILPTEKMKKASRSAWDVLNLIKMPGTTIDRKNLVIKSVDGGSVLLKINDIDATAQECMTLMPADIKRIEYIDNPGSRYSDSNVTYIVNILTKRNNTGGQAGVYESAALTTMSLYTNAYAKVNNGPSQFGLRYNNKYRDYANSYTDTYLSDGKDIDIFRKGENAKYGYLEQNMTASYNFSKEKLALDCRLDYYIYNNSKQDNPQSIFQDDELIGNSITSPYFRSHSPNLDLFAMYKFSDTRSLLFNTVGKYQWSKYKYRYEENWMDESSRYAYNVDGKRFSLITEMMYEQRLSSKTLWTIGARYKYSDTRNTYFEDISEITKSHDHDLYAHTQLAGKIWDIDYTAGIGVTWIDYRESQAKFHKVLFRPSARIRYSPFEDVNLLYNFSMQPITPSLSTLTGITKQLNRYEVESGNASLRPYKNFKHRFLLSWSPSRWYFQVSYNLETSRSLYASSMYASEEAIVYQRLPFNRKNIQKLEFYASYDIIKDMLSVEGYVSDDHYKYKSPDNNFHLHDIAYEGKIVFYWKHFSANASFSHTPKILEGMRVFTQESYGSIECSYKWKRFLFALGVWNPFKKQVKSSGFEYKNDNLYKKEAFFIKDNANQISIDIAYDIEWGKSYKATKKRLQNSDSVDGIFK